MGSTSGRTPPWNLRSVPRPRNSHAPIPGVGPPAARHPRLLATCVSRTRRGPASGGRGAGPASAGRRRGACVSRTSARTWRAVRAGAGGAAFWLPGLFLGFIAPFCYSLVVPVFVLCIIHPQTARAPSQASKACTRLTKTRGPPHPILQHTPGCKNPRATPTT